jgi:hypothetical protein
LIERNASTIVLLKPYTLSRSKPVQTNKRVSHVLSPPDVEYHAVGRQHSAVCSRLILDTGRPLRTELQLSSLDNTSDVTCLNNRRRYEPTDCAQFTQHFARHRAVMTSMSRRKQRSQSKYTCHGFALSRLEVPRVHQCSWRRPEVDDDVVGS